MHAPRVGLSQRPSCPLEALPLRFVGAALDAFFEWKRFNRGSFTRALAGIGSPPLITCITDEPAARRCVGVSVETCRGFARTNSRPWVADLPGQLSLGFGQASLIVFRSSRFP